MRTTIIDNANHLYSEFGRTTQADAYVCLDTRDGRLYCDSDAGPVPSAVDRATDRGLVRRWPVAALTQRAADALLRRVQPLAERLLAGDGDAADEIDDACREAGEVVEDVVVCEDAEDWLAAIGSADEQRAEMRISSLISDEQLTKIADGLRREAASESPPIVLRGLDEYLRSLRSPTDPSERHRLLVAEQRAELDAAVDDAERAAIRLRYQSPLTIANHKMENDDTWQASSGGRRRGVKCCGN